MKKFTLLVLAVLVVPQLALAAWWNPLSWFNNWKFSTPTPDTKTRMLENRVKELERKLENQTATPDDTAEVKPEPAPTVSAPAQVTQQTKVIASVVPIMPTAPNVSPNIAPTPAPVDFEKSFSDLIIKLNILKSRVENVISNGGYGDTSGLTGTAWSKAMTLKDINQKITARLYELKILNPQQKTQKTLDYFTTQYTSLQSSFDSLGLYVKTASEKAADLAAWKADDEARYKILQEENLKRVNIKLAELEGQSYQIRLINVGYDIDKIASMLPSITDLDDNTLFSNPVFPTGVGYTPNHYKEQVLLIIQTYITKLKMLQAQYSH